MANTTTDQNPFLRPSTLAHGAFPFDQLKKEHFIPALDLGIKEAKENFEKVRTLTAPPTFDNSILILESGSERVSLVSSVFYNLLSAESDNDLQALAKEISPKLADFSSDITLDPKIFAKVKAVHDNIASLKGEQSRLVEKTYKDFVRNGALLADDKKEELRKIDQELSKLSPEFSDNLLKATNAYQMHITNKADLAGLPESAIEGAAETAKEAKLEGWLFNLQAPSMIPFMTYADNHELRKKLWFASSSKAYKDQYDNSDLCIKIAQLRHQRAVLLGYKSHADFVLEERMAESPEKVSTFLERVLDKSLPAARRDVEQVAKLKKEMSPNDPTELMPWDYAYYAEKLKMRDYNFDEEELRPFFKLEKVIDGVFEHARLLYGLKFKALSGVPTYHADVRTYEVVDEKSGDFVGLFYADFFPRKSKRNGAWMTSFREQGTWNGKVERPHVSIVCNFTKPTDTKPSLLTMEEVRTLFHEFGHALHALLSQCTYVSLSGTNVYWDFVELPSQIMENWALEKEGLDLFAAHYETGEKIPVELTNKIKATQKFQAGYFSIRQVTFSMLDLAWHSGDPTKIRDVAEFEMAATKRTQILPKIPGTNASCSFSHIFAGGYSAGYYSYKWAEVLDADAFDLFKEKGLFDRTVADSFKENILSKGGTLHPMELYKKFRGREPDPDALLRRDGLI